MTPEPLSENGRAAPLGMRAVLDTLCDGDPDDHLALSIRLRIRITLASSPVKIASPIRK